MSTEKRETPKQARKWWISEYSVNYLQKWCWKLLILLWFSEGTVEMKSPRDWALQQSVISCINSFDQVEMKSPRDWALQHFLFGQDSIHFWVEMKSPRDWVLQQNRNCASLQQTHGRNGKTEIPDIAYFVDYKNSFPIPIEIESLKGNKKYLKIRDANNYWIILIQWLLAFLIICR